MNEPPKSAADVVCPSCGAGKAQPCRRTPRGMLRPRSTWDYCASRRARFLRAIGVLGDRERRPATKP